MGQTDTNNTQRNREENNQATVIVPDNQERDEVTSKDQHFQIQGPNQTDWGK